MVEPVSLQQILSMGTQVEKMQQVQQQQHDVSARNFAQDMRTTLDEKKIEVPGQEQGSEIKPADDQSRQKANQERKSKQQDDEDKQKIEVKKNRQGIGGHGSNIDIVV